MASFSTLLTHARFVFLAFGLLLGIQSRLMAQTPVSFLKSQVTGTTLSKPSSLQFGPDGRLYVSQVNGLIRAFTLTRTGPGQYAVTATETIDLVQKIPNYNDDGTFNPNVKTRQVLGLIVKGTPTAPVLYVSSNDPRTGGGNGDLNLDTNSGIISKLFKNANGNWEKIDLIRGLPKSEHNHATNGLQLDETSNTLYIAQGGHANKGAPSHELAWLPEFAYSAAILEADLDYIEALPTQGTGNNQYKYDLPTLTGVGPFGGNDGNNQAVLVPGGPVQIYAPGFRNAYDLVLSEAGKLYTWDNSSNANWGVPPIGRLADSLATNISEIDFDNNVDNVQATHYKINDNLTYFDPFHYISHRGYYAGNPNPTRANPAINRFNGLSPVPEGFDFGFWHGTNTKDGLENRFFHSGRAGLPKQNQSLFGVMGSTNGICEYRASNFNQSMKGNILGASFNGTLYRVVLNAQGTDIDHGFPHNGSGINGVLHLAEGFGTWNILDVTAQPDEAIFPGTIWIAEYSSNKITVLEPDDFSECAQNDPMLAPDLDFDNDGFTNQDEIDNGTDPCSAASSPEDWDGDLISDLNDSDDDNDGLADVVDAFALDPANGADTFLPIRYEWEASGSELAGYILNSGFSGLMVNGSSNYKNLYDIDELTVIGTGGLFTIDNTTNGSTLGLANDQAYGFQFGLNVGAFPGDYRFHTVVAQPFAGEDPALLSDQNMGIHLGKGDQSNYLKMVVDANNGAGGIRIVWEENDVIQHNVLYPVSVLGTQEVHLYLSVNRQTLEIQPAYSLENGSMVPLGSPLAVPTDWLEGVVATGILASAETGSPMGATWGFFRVLPVPSTAQAHIRIQTGNNLNTDTRTAGSFIIENTAPDGQFITQVILDLSTAVLPDLVFDPSNAIADQNPAMPFTAQEGESATGLAQVSFVQSPLGDASNGYRQLVLDFTDFAPGERLEFSLDTDPLSLKGSSPENLIGQLAGLELIGTQAIVKFNDGAGLLAPLYRVPAQEAQIQNILKQEAPSALQLRALDETQTPVETNNPVQTLRVEGRPGAEVQLLVLESGLFVQDVPNNGFEVQPFETNRVLQIVSEQSLVLSVNGTAEVDIQLTRTELPEGETGFHQVVAVEKEADGRTGAFSNVLQFHLLPGPPTASFRINSGGLAYTTTEGAAFEADGYFGTPSSAYNPANGLSIAGTEEDVLYNSERYGQNFAYNFPVDNGNYQVVLHFAEIYFGISGRGGTNTGLGSRVFNVSLEGQTMLNNFDIFAEAGGPAIALRKSFYVNVNDGNLNIQFDRITDNAKISAIEIIPAGTNTPPILENPLADRTYPYDPSLENPFSFVVPANTFSDLQDLSLTYTATQANGQPLPSWLNFDPATATFSGFASQYQVNPNFVDIQVNAFDSQGLSANDVFRITFLEPFDYYAVRLNAGKTTGPNVVAQNGYVFANDAYVTGGTTFLTPDLEIAHTEDDALYQSERYGNMTYNVPVENGAYRVILHFSENYFGLSAAGGIGSRVFHVDLEGQRRLSNYDIFARAGGSARAIREALFVNVSDGLLNIQFSNVNNNAKIAAIEILPFVPALEETPFSAPALIGASQRPILKLNIPDTGTQSISSLQFSTEGTTQTSDIVRARLLFSGSQNSLHHAVELATLEQPNGTFTLQGFNQALAEGDNFFWLVYDLLPQASLGGKVDARVLGASSSSGTLIPESFHIGQRGRPLAHPEPAPGQLLSFDGNNDYLTVPEESRFDFSNQLTVEAWIKVSVFDRQWQSIVTKGNDGWRLRRNNNTNKINFGLTSTTGSNHQVISQSDLNDGEWHHIAGVYTGSKLQLYVDGVKEAEINLSITLRNNNHAVMIGGNAQNTNRNFEGQMDEVRIWNQARTEAQIRESMHLIASGHETGLIGYWQLRQTEGNLTYDWANDLHASFSPGMNSANWTTATEPVGGGQALSRLASSFSTVDFGGIGLQIQTGETAPDGILVVSRLEDISPALVDPAPADTKFSDYFIIHNFGNTTGLSPMTLRFYLPAEFLLNAEPSTYQLHKRASNADDEAWTSFPASVVNQTENYMEFTGITGFSQVLISSSGATLPVRLLAFEGQRVNASEVQLQWSTASEENNLGFEIEKSRDAQAFYPLGFVEGAGNSVHLRQYTYRDFSASEAAYYRLKQKDTDGTHTYSPVVFVPASLEDFVRAIPNPVQTNHLDSWQLQAGAFWENQDFIQAQLIEAEGQIIDQCQGKLHQIESQTRQQLRQLSPGLYLLRLQSSEGRVLVVKLVRE